MKSEPLYLNMAWTFLIRFFLSFFFISPQWKVLQMVVTPRTDKLPSPSESLGGTTAWMVEGGAGGQY